MLDERDLEQIDSFLVKVGKGSLFEYYKLGTTAPADRLDRAVRKRREWAQGQQSNPKYRDEALWLIKNNNLVRRTLIDGRQDYVAFLTTRVDNKSLETLTLFVKGTLAAGVLTPEGEAAIHQQGKALGLPQDKVEACIEELLAETGVARATTPLTGNTLPEGDPWADDFTDLAEFVDHYAILEVEPEASLEDIEKAHRTRYRWARSLSDKRKASDIYAQLDEAWRVLKDPDRRSAFDAIYRMRNPAAGSGDDLFEDLISGTYEAVSPAAGSHKSTSGGPPPPPDLGADVAGSLGTTFQPAASKPPPEPPATRPEPPAARPEPRPALNFQASGVADHRPRPRPQQKSAPVPPPEVKRTVGLGATRTRRRGPRLALPGPNTLDLAVGRKPTRTSFAVKNAGGGRMRGRVSSNKDWLEVSPERLDPDAEEQLIEVVVHPKLMPRNESVGLVTLTTDHGDRETVTFRVQRSRVSSSEAVLFVVLALLVVSVAHSLGWLPDLSRLGGGDPDDGLAPASLRIEVDPRADAIFVDGRAVGSGEQVQIEGDLPLNKAFNVSVTLAGFEDVTERLTLAPGEVRALRVRLELSDPMDWEPDEDSERVALDESAIKGLLATRKEQLSGCLNNARAFGNSAPASLSAKLYATNIGRFQGLEVTAIDNLQKDPLPCLKRQLRTVVLPLLEGDYGIYEATFSIGPTEAP